MKFTRTPLEVEAIQYKTGCGIEDGFELWTKVVTNGWVVADSIVRIQRPDGAIVCPFIQNRRGITFIRENDYIITEADGERHVCGEDKFPSRFLPVQ